MAGATRDPSRPRCLDFPVSGSVVAVLVLPKGGLGDGVSK